MAEQKRRTPQSVEGLMEKIRNRPRRVKGKVSPKINVEMQELKERAEKLYNEMCAFSREFKELNQKRQEFEVHHAEFLVRFREFQKKMSEVGV